jgi:hypothetical protein
LVNGANTVAVLAADAVDVCRDCRDVVGYRVPLIAGKDTLFVMQLKINGDAGSSGIRTSLRGVPSRRN